MWRYIRRAMRFFSIRSVPLLCVSALLTAACGGDTDEGYQRPAHVPPQSRLLTPTTDGWPNIEELSGSEHGIAFFTSNDELHLFRGGREVVTKGVSKNTCPMTG